MADRFDAIIIGSGQGGTPLAQAFANKGWRTALVEAKHIGGTCINEGCTPTKTMIGSGRAAYTVCGAKAMGINFKRSTLQLNLETVRSRKRQMVESFRGGSERRINDTPNLVLVKGKARFKSSTEIDVLSRATGETKTLQSAKYIFINAGCAPAVMTIKGADVVDSKNMLDSTSIMELDSVPRHLLVIGGGPIGVEFAQLFRRFGAQVTIVQRAAHLVPHEDEDVSLEVEKILKDDGIALHLSARAQWFSTVPTGSVVLQIQTAEGETKSIFASHILNATGRPPNTADLNLGAAGVEIDKRGFIKVNEQLETTAHGIFALGDIKGGPAFTHISYDDFRILKHNLLSRTTSTAITTKDRSLPYCVFTDPQLGRIGLTEKEARTLYESPVVNNGNTQAIDDTSTMGQTQSLASNRRIDVATMPMSYVARALEISEPRGLMKAVIDRETDKILGFTALGYEGGEVMSTVQMAMQGGLTWKQLRDGIFAHPTMAEGLNNLFAQFGED